MRINIVIVIVIIVCIELHSVIISGRSILPIIAALILYHYFIYKRFKIISSCLFI